MGDLPPPDLHDHRGRLHRILIALLVGFAFGSIAWYVTYTVAGAGYDLEHGSRYAGKFIFMATGLAFVIAYQVTHALLTRRAKRAWDAERFPTARKL